MPREAKPTDPGAHVGVRGTSPAMSGRERGLAWPGESTNHNSCSTYRPAGTPEEGRAQSSTEKAVLFRLLDNRQIKLDKADTTSAGSGHPSYPAPAPGSCLPDPHRAPSEPDEGERAGSLPVSSQELKCPYWWSEQHLKGSDMFSLQLV